MAKKRGPKPSKGLEESFTSPYPLDLTFFLVGYGLTVEPALLSRILGTPPFQALHDPTQVKLLWLFAGTGLLLARLLAFPSKGHERRGRWLPLDASLLAVLATAGLSTLGSPHPSLSFPTYGAMVALGGVYFAMRLILRRRAAGIVRSWILAGALTALATFVLAWLAPEAWLKESPWGHGITVLAAREWVGPFGNPNHGASVALLTIFPAMAVCKSSDRRSWIAPALLGAVLFLSLARAAWLAFLLAALLAAIGSRWRSKGAESSADARPSSGMPKGALATLLLVALLTLPLAPLGKARALLNPGTLHKRMAYWKVAWDGLCLRPLLGHGPGSYTALWASQRPADYRALGLRPVARFAHSLPLQQGAESGLLGLLALTGLGACCLLPLLRERKLSRRTRALGLSCLAFGFHNLGATTAFVPATLAAFLLALALYATALEEEIPPKGSSPRPFTGLAMGLGVLMMAAFCVSWQELEGNALFHRAYLLRGRNPRQAEAALNALLAEKTGHLRGHYDLAGLLALRGAFDEAERRYAFVDQRVPGYDEVVANRCTVALHQARWKDALALATRGLARDEGSPELWVALARAQWNLGDGNASRRAMDRALQLRPGNGELLRLRRAITP